MFIDFESDLYAHDHCTDAHFLSGYLPKAMPGTSPRLYIDVAMRVSMRV